MKGLKEKILIPLLTATGIIFILTFIGIFTVGHTHINQLLNKLEQNKYNAIEMTVKNSINDTFNKMELALQPVVNNPEIQQALAKRNRQKLIELTYPIWEQINKDGIDQFQFIEPPAINFLRLQNLEEFSDDLSFSRKNVAEASNTQKTVSGMEEVGDTMYFSVVSPVFQYGLYIGSAEYSTGVNGELLSKWKNNMGGEYYFYSIAAEGAASDTEKNKTFLASTKKEDGFTVSKDRIKKILSTGKTEVITGDNNFTGIIIPINNFQGKAVGYVKCVLDSSEILNEKKTTSLLILTIVFIAFLLVCGTIIFILSKVLNPITNLENKMSVIADGDLTQQINTIARDDIGALAGHFNKMVENLRVLVIGIIDKTAGLSESVEQLSANAGEVFARAGETASSVTGVSSTMLQIARTTYNIKEVVDDTSGDAADGQTRLESLNTHFTDVGRSIYHTAVSFQDINIMFNKINQFVDNINAIAEHTQYLSLTAAIESTKAGEQCRGFANTAEEIRILAKQSTDSTDEIKSLIDNMLNDNNESVKLIKTNLDKMQSGVDLLDETCHCFSRIMDRVGGMTNHIDEIAKETEQVSFAVKNASDVQEETAVIIENVATATESLVRLVDDLQHMVAQFKVDN